MMRPSTELKYAWRAMNMSDALLATAIEEHETTIKEAPATEPLFAPFLQILENERNHRDS